MITRKRTEPSAHVDAEPPEDQAAELVAPVAVVEHLPEVLTDDTTAEGIADLAARYHEAAEASANAAEQDQAEYDALIAAGQAKAARVIADTVAQAAPLADSAAAQRTATESRRETNRRLAIAATYAAKAEKSEAGVQALEDERAELTRKQEELTARTAPLEAERRDLEAQLVSATEAADLDLMTSLRNRIDSIRAAEAVLSRQYTAAQARLDQLGNGEMMPLWPQKELAEARRVAKGDRHQAVDALNHALPGRPEAVAARERQHEQELDRFERDQYDAARADEARRQAQRRVLPLPRR